MVHLLHKIKKTVIWKGDKAQFKFPVFIYSILDVQNHKKYTYMCHLRQVKSSVLFYRACHLFSDLVQFSYLNHTICISECQQNEDLSLVTSSQHAMHGCMLV